MRYDRSELQEVKVSIHASRAGGDTRRSAATRGSSAFQSTPPAREATSRYELARAWDLFQSTPPAREATSNSRAGEVPSGFQSTPPAREATTTVLPGHVEFRGVSIHASRAGGDRTGAETVREWIKFQSTPPAREATGTRQCSGFVSGFQSTPPAREATREPGNRDGALTCFNPRLPRGRRRSWQASGYP